MGYSKRDRYRVISTILYFIVALLSMWAIYLLVMSIAFSSSTRFYGSCTIIAVTAIILYVIHVIELKYNLKGPFSE